MDSSNNGIPISADTIITTLTLVSSFHPVSSALRPEGRVEQHESGSQGVRNVTDAETAERGIIQTIQTPCSSLLYNLHNTFTNAD